MGKSSGSKQMSRHLRGEANYAHRDNLVKVPTGPYFSKIIPKDIKIAFPSLRFMTNQKTIDRIVVALFFPAGLAGTLAGDYITRNVDCVAAYMQSVECSVYRNQKIYQRNYQPAPK